MKQLRILKIVIIANLKMSENGPGSVSVTVKDESAAIPDQIVAGSTGELTAVLGPVTIGFEPNRCRSSDNRAGRGTISCLL
jgi:hypothetical protein